jgi:hypothetical protein
VADGRGSSSVPGGIDDRRSRSAVREGDEEVERRQCWKACWKACWMYLALKFQKKWDISHPQRKS